MDSLPYDVFVHIFQYLPLSCRNQVRLVSRSWNSACNDTLITKKEILDMHHENRLSTMRDVFSILAHTKRSILNLTFGKFEEFPLFLEETASSYFWLNNGTKVKYLKFEKTNFDVPSLVRILECCPNLIELHCHELNEHSDFVDVLNVLSLNNVIFTNVACLTIEDSFKKISCLNEALLKVFPNVTNLRLEPHNYFGRHGPRDRFGAYVPACNYVLQISSQLEHVNLSDDLYPILPDWLSEDEVTSILATAKRLKTLKLPDIRSLTWEHVSQLSALKYLTTLHLDVMSLDLSFCEFLVPILDIVPKLRHLEVDVEEAFGLIDDNVVNKLSTSSLQSLRVNCPMYNDPVEKFGGVDVSDYTPNDTLETLKIILTRPECSATDPIISFFLKYYRKLKHLQIWPLLTSSTFEVMCAHQENLKNLAVHLDLGENSSMIVDDEPVYEYFPNYDWDEGPDYQWNDLTVYSDFEWFSFRQFKYLEELQLGIHSWFSWTKYSFSDFMLPQLKYLRVLFFWNSDDEPGDYEILHVPSNLIDFLHAIEKLPLLEYLKLEDYQQTIPHDLVLQLCESQRNLRHLILCRQLLKKIRLNHNYSTNQYARLSNLFSICESLRFVCHEAVALRKNLCTNEIELSAIELES